LLWLLADDLDDPAEALQVLAELAVQVDQQALAGFRCFFKSQHYWRRRVVGVAVVRNEGFTAKMPEQFIEAGQLRVIRAANEHRQAGAPALARQLAGRAQAILRSGTAQHVELHAR